MVKLNKGVVLVSSYIHPYFFSELILNRIISYYCFNFIANTKGCTLNPNTIHYEFK